MRKRPRTRSQQANAEKLLDAMVAETVQHGLDNLQSARVAKTAGLTTGALYSRYENADEMLVALWQERVRTPFLAHLREVVQYVQGHLPADHPITRAVERPGPLLQLGAEFLVIAQRNDTVSEVRMCRTRHRLPLVHYPGEFRLGVITALASRRCGSRNRRLPHPSHGRRSARAHQYGQPSS